MTMTSKYLCPWYASKMTSVPQVTTIFFWCVNWCAGYLQNMPGAQVFEWCAKKFPNIISIARPIEDRGTKYFKSTIHVVGRAFGFGQSRV